MKNTISPLISILNNDEKLYAGNDLWYYAKKLFFAKNTKNGYHNFRHMMHVTCEVYDAIRSEKINPISARKLLIAAMFHDYGHTGDGTIADTYNIQKAVQGIKDHRHDSDRKYLNDIIRLIQGTEWFGSGHTAIELDMFIKILRDADISQNFSDVWMQQILFGLGAEQKKSPREMLEIQIPFLQNNVKFLSSWGKRKFTPLLQARIAEVKIWQEKLLNPDI